MIHIIAICGLKRSGKDTVANIIQNHTNFKKKHIASTLKEVCKLLFDFTDNQVDGLDKDVVDSRLGISPRQAMQYFGTDIMQYHMDGLLPNCGRNFWIDNFINKNKHRKFIIISDMRFLHEYNILRAQYADSLLVIKVLNNNIKNDCVHSSEVEWNDIPHDIVVKNNSSIKKLSMQVEVICNVFLKNNISNQTL
jgi:hypothetical protein